MPRRYLLTVWSTLLLCIIPFVNAKAISACVADVDYHPFAFNQTDSHDNQASLHGASVDILNRILTPILSTPIQVTRLPQRRCLALASIGSFDIVLNVTGDTAIQGLHLSEAYYVVHPIYFFSLKRNRSGINIASIEDLKRYRVCVLQGTSVEHFGLAIADVDSGAKDYAALIAKTHAGHCDLFIDERESLAGRYLLDPLLHKLFSDPALDSHPMPSREELALRFGISSAAPSWLLKAIDHGIAELNKQGVIEEIVQRYMTR